MTAEECVLLAVALDYQTGFNKSPLLGEQIKEVAVLEDRVMNVVRILVVTTQRMARKSVVNLETD